ncbi:MAG: N-acetylmuramoyl-L-alanine amidase [Chitinophagales bacterium]
MLGAVGVSARAALLPPAPPSNLTLVFNGETQANQGRLVGGVILVPLEALTRQFAIASGYLQETRTLRLESFGKVVYLTLGNKVALADGKSLKLVEPAQLFDGRIYVPLRFLGELLGLEVVYSARERRVEVRGPEYGVTAVAFGMQDGRPAVTIDATRPPSVRPSLKRNPLRVVLDVEGGRLAVAPGTTSTQDPVAPKLAWAQPRPDLAQVTITLGREVGYELVQDGSRFTLLFPPEVRSAALVTRDGRRYLTVDATAPVKANVSRLSNPDRLVVDFPGAALAGPARIEVGDAWVDNLRLGQLDASTVRVVATLAGPLGFREEALPDSDRPPATMWSAHLYNRVTKLETATLRDRSQVRMALAVPAVPAVAVDRKAGRLSVSLSETLGEGLPSELAVGDGTVSRVRLETAGPPNLQVALDLPYYVGHQVLAETPRVAVVEVSRSPVYRQKIYLDPGHGGSDPGAIGPGGLQEKEVNLDVALRVRDLLTDAGALVSLSRETDAFIPLHDRPKDANDRQVAAFVSLHHNASLRKDTGTEVYYHPEHGASRDLAVEVQRRVPEALGLLNRGIKISREFVVLKETTMPAILVEGGFISNPDEEKRLADPAFRQKEAAAVAEGIIAFFRAQLELPAPPAAPLATAAADPAR